MPVFVDENVLDEALDKARMVGAPKGLPVRGLHAPLDETLSSSTNELWDLAEGAVRTSWENGKQAAARLLAEFHEKLEQVRAKVGEGFSTVRRVIVERLNNFFTALVEGALERIQPRIKVAGKSIEMRTVKIEQTLKMSSSLKASLEDICEFVAEGEVAVSAEYEIE